MPITSANPEPTVVSGAHNPFSAAKTMLNGGRDPVGGSRHMSNESIDFTGLNSGRHSPDAFAGLSASFVR